jgi:predicted RNA binding protein YcfA (HicA-like mRNA interferase family)
MKTKKLIQLLKKNGWNEVRHSGSHKIFKNPDFKNNIPIPIHGGKDIKKGTLFAILKKSGIILQ